MSYNDLFFFNKLLLVDDYATFHTRIRNRAFDITSVEFNIKQAAVTFIHLANTFALRVIKNSIHMFMNQTQIILHQSLRHLSTDRRQVHLLHRVQLLPADEFL